LLHAFLVFLVAVMQISDVIKKSGTTTQLGVIVFLMIVLVVLAVVAFT
jgi:hypothetical protein